MPGPADASFLAELVDRLAPAFGQPRFAPHITIQGDLEVELEALAADAQHLAGRYGAQRWPVLRTEHSEHFFRCLYLRFEATAVFGELQSATQAFSGTAKGLSPYPHLSLAYGRMQAQHGPLLEDLRVQFAGRKLTFDHLAVCRSSKDLPITEWECVAAYPLLGPCPTATSKP